MPNLDPNYRDLYDILPDAPVDYTNYSQCEQNILTPALRELGYVLQPSHSNTDKAYWFTGDGDSFGPLSRCIRATTPDGKSVIIVYG